MALPVVAILGDEARLRALARGWKITETIYGVPGKAILSLASAAPKSMHLSS